MDEHWEVDHSGFNIKEAGKPITVAMTQPHSRMKQRARLIAAAPELLAALKEVLEWSEDDRDLSLHNENRKADWRIVLDARRSMLRAAIAKATGGAS